MNRTFHSKVRFDQIVYLILLTALCVFLIWEKQAILSTIIGLLIVVLIERIIHTEFILSEKAITINKGRFTKSKSVQLDDILDVEIKTTTKFGSHYLMKYILLTLKDKRYIGITPSNIEECYKAIVRKKESYKD